MDSLLEETECWTGPLSAPLEQRPRAAAAGRKWSQGTKSHRLAVLTET